MSGRAFVPGLELSRRFHQDEVGPLLQQAFPGLPYSAALLGRGSEVLGFDDEMSTDHSWEPRVVIFLRDDDLTRRGDAVADLLRERLPPLFDGHPTDHALVSMRGYFLEHLDVDIAGELEARDWLTFPEQGLLMVTAGAVFHDDLGLHAVRERFAHYPRDVWLYLLLAGWWRVHPEANLVGRAGFVGDELGSALIGSRLVHDLMRLCFLMERQYAPYPKWFATAFSRLACAPALSPSLGNALRAETWQQRERALMTAYEQVAALHDRLQITPPVRTEVVQMWDRPFQVVWGEFPAALHSQIQDPAVLRIADRWPTGGIDHLRDLGWGHGSRSRLLRLFD